MPSRSCRIAPSSRTACAPSLLWDLRARTGTRIPAPPQAASSQGRGPRAAKDAVGGEQGRSCWHPNPPCHLCLCRARRCALPACDRVNPLTPSPAPPIGPAALAWPASAARMHGGVRHPRYDVQLPCSREVFSGHLAHYRADVEPRLPCQPRAPPLRSNAQAREHVAEESHPSFQRHRPAPRHAGRAR
eukprot:3832931-Pleurochrysis_carterae.AAC.1